MSVATALFDYLSNAPAVAALVTTAGARARIYPPPAPQGVALPFVTYQRAGGAPENHLRGPSRLDHPRYQFDCYDATHEGAMALADVLTEAFKDIGGHFSPEGDGEIRSALKVLEQDLSEFETDLFRVSMDFSIYWRQNQ